MYVTLRLYAGAAERMDQIAAKVQEGLVPILARSDGFKGYCAVKADGGDGVSVTLFEQEAQATQAHQQARSWVQSELSDLLPDPPEVFAGPVMISAETEEKGGAFGNRGGEVYVVIRKFENMTDPDEAVKFGRETALPATRRSPGFLAFYAAWGDPGRTTTAVVSLFASRESAEQTSEQILSLIREKGGSAVPKPSQVIVGRALVVAGAS
jgi:hypothetical protein